MKYAFKYKSQVQWTKNFDPLRNIILRQVCETYCNKVLWWLLNFLTLVRNIFVLIPNKIPTPFHVMRPLMLNLIVFSNYLPRASFSFCFTFATAVLDYLVEKRKNYTEAWSNPPTLWSPEFNIYVFWFYLCFILKYFTSYIGRWPTLWWKELEEAIGRWFQTFPYTTREDTRTSFNWKHSNCQLMNHTDQARSGCWESDFSNNIS